MGRQHEGRRPPRSGGEDTTPRKLEGQSTLASSTGLPGSLRFVDDSFKEENEELKRFEFGDRIVAVEKSDHVYGGAIFGGTVPDGVYLSLRHFLADMEDRYADRLVKWSGDVADLPGLKDMMEYFGRRGEVSHRGLEASDS